MKTTTHNGGEGWMRADDHQFFQDMYIASFGPRTAGEPFDEEKTDWGWKIVAKIPAEQTVLPTSCKMNKPS
jgi:branched-chain amino acid transport system substrate-binding protein